MKLHTSFTSGLVSLAFVGLLAIAGCSDDGGLSKRFAVSGKVTYKGAPVANGLISFVSASPDGRSATGTIKDGYYKMTTQDPDDGAFPGAYSVTVTAKTPDMAKAAEAAKAKGSTSAYTPIDFTAAANKKAPNAVPARYGVLQSSPLKAEVKAQANTFDFDLTDQVLGG